MVLLQGLWPLFPIAVLVAVAGAWKGGLRPRGAVVALVLLAACFVLALSAQATDFRDADGWIDCWPSCSGVQRATGAGLSYVPALGVLLSLAMIVLTLARRRR